MSNILEKIPEMSQSDMELLRSNALRILNENKSPQTALHAEEVLAAIDEQLVKRYLPGMIKTFYEVYPGGFSGEKQAEEERNYKLAACNKFAELLSEESFEALLAEQGYDELFQRVSHLVGMTNFIQGSYEKPKFLSNIQEPGHLVKFYPALFQVLYGNKTKVERFADWCAVLENIGLAKWTYATYFVFLADPESSMFVKPEMLKKSIDLCKYPLEYESAPSAALYKEILSFSDWLKSKISELEPRDMIDVHSFMWHMAPTGKWAEDA
ncbi:MAG: hypothetical protein V7746_11895 [Halioglobus sp.]